jgi:hypothetical protein
MNKKQKIKSLETELRILNNEIYIHLNKTGLHAHHNKKLLRYYEVMSELQKLSLKWRFKKIIRRLKLWLKSN